MRTFLVAVAMLLITPASALAAGKLTVTISGAGKVTGSGIDCTRSPGVGFTGPCSADVDAEATIAAAPAAGFTFDGWTGACADSGATCTIPVPADRTTNATFIDVQPPVVTLDPPSGPIAGTVTFTAEVTDNGVIDRVELKSRYGKIVDTVAPYEGPFLSGLVPDGPELITATAYDKAGNSTVKTAEVLVDNTLPVLTVTGPDRVPFPPGTTQTWALGAADAGSGVKATRCSVVPNGEAPVLVPCSGAGEHSVSGLAEGRYTFTFKAMDGAENVATETRSFRIETPEAPLAESPAAPAAELAAAAPAAPELDDVDAPRVLVALGFRYVSGERATKLSRFIVRGVPAGATVTVRCPSGCARKTYAKTVKRAGRVSLKPLVKRALKVDTTVTVTVSKPGATAAVKVLTIRARKAPLVSTLCQPEGAPEPVAC